MFSPTGLSVEIGRLMRNVVVCVKAGGAPSQDSSASSRQSTPSVDGRRDFSLAITPAADGFPTPGRHPIAQHGITATRMQTPSAATGRTSRSPLPADAPPEPEAATIDLACLDSIAQ